MAARARNWKELDAAHRRCGELITVVFSPDAVGAFQRPAHRAVFGRGGTLLRPPPRNARVCKPHHRVQDEPALRFRNSQLTPLQRLGRTQGEVQSGCSRRSYVESMMHRLKSLTGASRQARTLERQKVEVRLRCKVLNATSTST